MFFGILKKRKKRIFEQWRHSTEGQLKTYNLQLLFKIFVIHLHGTQFRNLIIKLPLTFMQKT